MINIDKKAKEKGFRNFTSFIFIYYFDKKISLLRCSKVIGVSYHKLRISIISRGWPIRLKSQIKKKKVDRLKIWDKVRHYTPFIFPWCAIYNYYYKRFLTTHEVGRVLGISQTSVIKLMDKWGMKRRKQGVRKFYGDS